MELKLILHLLVSIFWSYLGNYDQKEHSSFLWSQAEAGPCLMSWSALNWKAIYIRK